MNIHKSQLFTSYLPAIYQLFWPRRFIGIDPGFAIVRALPWWKRLTAINIAKIYKLPMICHYMSWYFMICIIKNGGSSDWIWPWNSSTVPKHRRPVFRPDACWTPSQWIYHLPHHPKQGMELEGYPGFNGGSMVVQWWFNGGSMVVQWWFNGGLMVV